MFRFVDYVKEFKARLARHGIAHAEIARLAKMDGAQFSRFINGINAPTLKTVERLEKAFQKAVEKQQK